MRGRAFLSVALGVLLGLVISHAVAEEVVEAWRSVPPAFSRPYSVSVNPTDGSCWVTDTDNSQVVHLSAAGAELWRSASGAFSLPESVSVNPTNGSCWVADYWHSQVVHLSAAGAELWRSAGGAFSYPFSVSVNPTDGSCWVADLNNGQVVHLSAAGEELWRSASGEFNEPYSVSANPTDGSCWVADYSNSRVVHLSAAGAELWRSASGAFNQPDSVSVNPTDGSCWVADANNSQVVHLSAAGAELWRSASGTFCGPYSVSANPTDGSCWVADYQYSEVVHLSAAGAELWRSASGEFDCPYSVSVNPTDGSCWVADGSQVVHLSSAGAELWRSASAFYSESVSVNPTDGSCWVADTGHSQVVHLSAAGAELWRSASGAFNYPYCVSVNPADGSCWVADTYNSQVVHLSAAGAESWRSDSGAFNYPKSVSVNPTDGSCWVADYEHSDVVHLSAGGAEQWRSASGALIATPLSVSVNPTDGSCWVGDFGHAQVVHLSAAGEESWRSDSSAFSRPQSVSVNPTDGSCWVADYQYSQVVHLDVVGYGGAPDTVSFSTFEPFRSPFTVFAAGSGEANTWRTPLTGDVTAHSGLYAMSSEVTGLGVTGLRLDLPTEPNGPAEVDLRAWAYVADRTVGDASAFFGLAFDEAYPTAASGWSGYLGWEALSDTTSRYQLAGSTQSVEAGLAGGAWHLVQLRYVRATNDLILWLDGQEKGTVNAPGAAGQTPCYVVLGALGEAEGATQHVYFDDVQVTLVGYSGPPTANHAFALLEGLEQVAEDQTVGYTLQCGNGYPMLGTREATQTLPQAMYVGLSLPAGYSLVSADPLPDRVGEGTAVWALDLPAMQQAGYIYLNLHTPTGLAEVTEDRIWAWATTDSGAATTDPPSPPNWTDPSDPIWGAPQDVLPQRIELEPKSDVWVRKRGPRSASPGDTVVYSVTVGNSGFAPAEEVVVRDLMPELLGGGDRIVANLGDLEVGETWTGAVSGALPWGVPGGTLLLNTAYVPTGPMEVSAENNRSEWTTTVQAARDPNAISVSPSGGVDRGERPTYTLECENTGLGTAYGVYATATLDGQLNGATLLVSDPDAVSYDPQSRTLVWEVGTLGAGEGASVTFTVSVASNARRARPIIEQAVVYFPSVPETTPTNVVFNVVNSTFPDVPWDHWAILPIEQAFENGIVFGYDGGTYQPAWVVDRGQMAVYVARALAGGDQYVPTGPATPTFPDVDTDHWAYKYVEYAYDQQVVQGYEGGTYQPAWSVDRGQMAVYMARALGAPAGDAGVPAPPLTPTFSDVTPTGASAWCYPHVEYVVDEGVVGGYEDGTYRPEYTVTREQMAVYVARAFRLPM